MEESSGIYNIRPAGRHLNTIGRDLIGDKYAAIVELVKNAYDADASMVQVSFYGKSSREFEVVIEDDGHGMHRDVVLNKWLVPSTDDKVVRVKSPAGRVMQGKKGIGRYAAAILGETLQLETVQQGLKTQILICWDDFEKAEFLDQVEVLVQTNPSSQNRGTKLTISATGNDYLWEKHQFDRMIFELRKLTAPKHNEAIADNEHFQIEVVWDNFIDIGTGKELIEPIPLLDMYDYRISGSVGNSGQVECIFSTQKIKSRPDENISLSLSDIGTCGTVVFDIRVYDRDAESIDELIGRGLKSGDSYIGKREARRLLDQYNGIGVYRNGFRIRPLGDPANDWIELNRRRVQNPSMRIGSDQAIGYIKIESENESGLVEKSARDGLKENPSYFTLKERVIAVIAALETRRFDIRRRLDLGKGRTKVSRHIGELFETSNLTAKVKSEISKLQTRDESVGRSIVRILEEHEQENARKAAEVQAAFAVYQGQATIGKIVNVILHEGRRPLNYFRNQIPNLEEWVSRFSGNHNQINAEKILQIGSGISTNADNFVHLFARLDPLATSSRGKATEFDFLKAVHETIGLFQADIQAKQVSVDIQAGGSSIIKGWRQDIHAILANLIENSLYWMDQTNEHKKTIQIDISSEDGKFLRMDYKDSGPGIEEKLLLDDLIFEPNFSTKPFGTGLGLSIAGEAASRNSLELKAFLNTNGAYFRLELQNFEEGKE
jgi:signal transduction histidine kinase